MINRKIVYIILFLFTISLSAQNVIINAKYNKSFSGRIAKQYTLETLFSFHNNQVNLGVFAGITKIIFNEINESFYENRKGIYGITTYFYLLPKKKYPILSSLFINFKLAKISDRILEYLGGCMISDPGIYFKNSKNDKLFSISVGVKAETESFTFIFDWGYQHRDYDFTYFLYYYDEENGYLESEKIIIYKIEDSFFYEFGLQFVL